MTRMTRMARMARTGSPFGSHGSLARRFIKLLSINYDYTYCLLKTYCNRELIVKCNILTLPVGNFI